MKKTIAAIVTLVMLMGVMIIPMSATEEVLATVDFTKYSTLSEVTLESDVGAVFEGMKVQDGTYLPADTQIIQDDGVNVLPIRTVDKNWAYCLNSLGNGTGAVVTISSTFKFDLEGDAFFCFTMRESRSGNKDFYWASIHADGSLQVNNKRTWSTANGHKVEGTTVATLTEGKYYTLSGCFDSVNNMRLNKIPSVCNCTNRCCNLDRCYSKVLSEGCSCKVNRKH